MTTSKVDFNLLSYHIEYDISPKKVFTIHDPKIKEKE